MNEAELLTGHPYTFILFTSIVGKSGGRRQYLFQAPSKIESERWISTLGVNNDQFSTIFIPLKQKLSRSKEIKLPQKQPKIEKKLKNQSFDLDISAFNDAVIIADSAAIILDCNSHVETLFNWPKTALIGKPVTILMPPSISKYHDDYVQRYHETGVKNLIGVPRKIQAITKSGESIPVLISLGESKSADGKIFIATFRSLSITEANISEEQLMGDIETKADSITKHLKVVMKTGARDYCQSQASLLSKQDKLRIKLSGIEDTISSLAKQLSVERNIHQKSVIALLTTISIYERVDNFKSLEEQTQVVVKKEIEKETEFSNLLERCLLKEKLEGFLLLYGSDYLAITVGDIVDDIVKRNKHSEVSTEQIQLEQHKQELSKENIRTLQKKWREYLLSMVVSILQAIFQSSSVFPLEYYRLFAFIRNQLELRWTASVVSPHLTHFFGNILLLGLFCPALMHPDEYGLVEGKDKQHLLLSNFLSGVHGLQGRKTLVTIVKGKKFVSY